jgi:hypothetical protein
MSINPYTVETLPCPHCDRAELTYDPLVLDAKCGACGEWCNPEEPVEATKTKRI